MFFTRLPVIINKAIKMDFTCTLHFLEYPTEIMECHGKNKIDSILKCLLKASFMEYSVTNIGSGYSRFRPSLRNWRKFNHVI